MRIRTAFFVAIGISLTGAISTPAASSLSSVAATGEAKRLPLIAVMPLTGQGVDESSALIATDALSDELLKAKRVRVLERSQMESILKEQGFQKSGYCDGTECAVQMGKLLSIEKIVVGTLGRIGSSYSLSVRVVDVGSGEIVGSVRRMQRGEIELMVSDVLPEVAQQISLQVFGTSREDVPPPPSELPTIATPPPPNPQAKLAEPAPAPPVISAEAAKDAHPCKWDW